MKVLGPNFTFNLQKNPLDSNKCETDEGVNIGINVSKHVTTFILNDQ